MKIIDVSKHNGIINWNYVKAAGVEGVIIRAGYGRHISQKDSRFEANYSGALAAGLHVGAYWYSYADNPADAKTEAEVFLEAIKGKKFDLPVYFDIEEQKHVKAGRTMCTAMTEAFCSTVEKAGYFTGVYSFDSFFTTNLYPDISKKYTCWVARIGGKPKNIHDMWQYSWKEKIKGINGETDVNNCYKDFPSIIVKAKLNGYGAETKYKVTAHVSGVDKLNADKIAKACSEMGMTVVTEEV
ncbi:MAG: glycoside hydrolase family 25 protein [Oscillospiraceae bacterium]|nr:glycoside hydrolase family 25 protein [Oscillospiraceae bacterium]